MINNHRFLFLCGLHRSGTSPLFKLLREHVQISGFRDTGVKEDEGQHLQTVYPPASLFGGAGKFGFRPEAHLTEESDLITARNREELFQQWSKYWDLSKPWLLEKSPPNLIRTRFLQALFPNSYFVVLLRHPIAVSLATWKWANCPLESLIRHWLHCHRVFEEDRRKLRHVLVLRYEDLIQDTERSLAEIYTFLNLPVAPCIPLNPDGNDRYIATWRELGAGRMADVISHLREHYERDVNRFGYSLRSESVLSATHSR